MKVRVSVKWILSILLHMTSSLSLCFHCLFLAAVVLSSYVVAILSLLAKYKRIATIHVLLVKRDEDNRQGKGMNRIYSTLSHLFKGCSNEVV